MTDHSITGILRERQVNTVTRTRTATITLIILIALTTAGIWWFSLHNSFDSSRESKQLLKILSNLLGAGTVSDAAHLILRKVAHFVEFAVLGAEWMALAHLRRRWWWALPGAVTAIVDECLQIFAPGRAPRVTDVLLDWSGYLIGAILVWGIWWIFHRKKGLAFFKRL